MWVSGPTHQADGYVIVDTDVRIDVMQNNERAIQKVTTLDAQDMGLRLVDVII